MTEQYPFLLFYAISVGTRVLAYAAEELLTCFMVRTHRNTPLRSSMKGASIFAQPVILLLPMIHAWTLGLVSVPLYGLWLAQSYYMATYKPIVLLPESGVVGYNRPTILYRLFAFEIFIFSIVWFGF